MRNTYTATTSVLPPAESSSGLAAFTSATTLLSIGGHSGADLYVQLLQSRTVADSLIAKFRLEQVYKTKFPSSTRAALAARTKIDLNEKSNLISISVTDTAPDRAASLANGYVLAYRAMSARLAISQAARKREFFSQQLLAAKNNLADAEEKLAATQKQTGFVQPESQTQALISSAAGLRAQVAAKEVQIQAMRNFATAENPQMQQAETELSGLQGQLAALGSGKGGDASDLIMPRNAVQNGGLEYIRASRDVKYFETLYDMLARQLETARLEEAREGSGIEVVDPAVTPDRKSGPKRSLILAGSLVFGFLAGCCWVLGRLSLAQMRERWHETEPALLPRT